ncbi:MAG: mechanosensitive ion channel family protein [Pseudomonadales bacterium]|nr:mechanosensitive ion channel family protein [Pseudomonadales bacterium]
MEAILGNIENLTDILLLVEPFDYFVLALNLVLFLFAKKILNYFYNKGDKNSNFLMRVTVFRFLNVLIFILYGYHYLYAPTGKDSWDFQLIGILATLYIGYIAQHISTYFIQLRFGKEREVNGDKRIIETYNTRLLSILSTIFITVITLITLVRLLGFETWLEAGGVLGFIGVFLALTQAAWAPDVFSGLIILNSGIVEEGDVIEVNGGSQILGIIFKTKMFHTEVLNLVNNHRIMIRNSHLREHVIHNLSKFASAKGLREKLIFNIGYESEANKVRQMFDAAFQAAAIDSEIKVEEQYPAEIRTLDAGDYAVKWAFFYYTKDVKNLLSTRHKMIEKIIFTAKDQGIELSTPVLNRFIPSD